MPAQTEKSKLTALSARLPYNWRVQHSNQGGCLCVAYVDARQVQDLLDEVMGPSKWQCLFYEVAGRPFCKIGVKFGDEWIWKADTGSESNIEREKGLASDCFKRAAVHFGVARFLYSMDPVWLPTWKNDKGKWLPMHDPSKGLCPPKFCFKTPDGQQSLVLDERKLTNYIREVLKRD